MVLELLALVLVLVLLVLMMLMHWQARILRHGIRVEICR